MAVPLLHVYLVYMRLYIVQQFIIFIENVEKASLFLSETSLYISYSIQMLLSYTKCTIFQGPRIAGYLPQLRLPAPAK